MIDKLYNIIDDIEYSNYDDYLQSLNGSVFKKITEKNIYLNQKQLTPFYIWNSESIAKISSFDQYKYTISSLSGTSSINFNRFERDNRNIGNQKIYFHSASFGYVLAEHSLRYDAAHENILYYYGYANRFGIGTPFNVTSSGATQNIPSESRAISPSKIAYASIKNIISDESYVKNNRIQLKENIYTDEFVYLKIPRNQYHEEILNGSFQLTLATGSMRLDLADVSKYNIFYNEDNVVYIVSASSQSDIQYISGNLDIYGILDRKNGLAIIDVPKLNSYFGQNTFTTQSSKIEIGAYNFNVYKTESFGVVYIDEITANPYTSSYYSNLNVLTKLLYSGSQEKQFSTIGLETEVSDHYYVQIGPGEFNRSLNPTYLENLRIKTVFMKDPVVYITTIGLYNDFGDCIAIGKLSKPLKKNYNTSYVFKIQIKQ